MAAPPPFTPTASVPPKVVKRILELEYVEMEKAPELFAYQATILRADRNYEGKRWVQYNRQFRREALARKDLNGSVTNSRLYNETFTGRARAIPRCSYCGQDDHGESSRQHNPSRPLFGLLTNWAAFPGYPLPAQQQIPQRQQTPSMEICRKYNKGRCRKVACTFRHACLRCSGQHPQMECR